MKSRNLAIIFCVVLASLFTLSGCKVTGGGWIGTAEPECDGKANFGFVAMLDDDESTPRFIEFKGKLNFNDKCAGVKLNGDVKFAITPGGEEWNLLGGTYRSTNPNNKGDGFWIVMVKDMGEGINEIGDGDEIRIRILSGPFAGYTNQGYVQGNIQAHD